MLERISRREEFDLLVAWIAISVAFAIIFLRGAGRADPGSGRETSPARRSGGHRTHPRPGGSSPAGRLLHHRGRDAGDLPFP